MDEDLRERLRQIEIENVRLQVENLLNFTLVKHVVSMGEIEIYGLYYDSSTGLSSRIV